MAISSCQTTAAPSLNWHGTIWAGSSQYAGVVGKINGTDYLVECSAQAFDKYVCLTHADFASLQKAEDERLLKCEKWK